ncbi:MAG: DUF86 domain-containing protein [Candidatus Omnitrophica bacterium]|nr:DUF86 domain-containing protein [Candidatus Omnitrophota bacterium]
MSNNDLVRIKHILDASEETVKFLENRKRKDIDTDRMLSLSLVRLLEIIGEAARGVSLQLREKYTAIPWKQMAGIRDRLIHGYFDVDMEIVWKTIKEDIPPLINQLTALLDNENLNT